MLMIVKALFMLVNFLFTTENDSEYGCKSFVYHWKTYYYKDQLVKTLFMII